MPSAHNARAAASGGAWDAAYPSGVSRAVPIPSGTVTLLFTDVEGSTKLWEAEPEAMAEALRRHDEILRRAIEHTGGYVFKTVGDAFCAAFSTPAAALQAVLAAQEALMAESWPTTRPIRVRMGVHTGACEERDEDYFGPVVNRTARLQAVAHGGQVLVSGATAELLSDGLGDGVALRDLGSHRLKDLGRPEQVYQLEASFLQASFPPLRSLDNPELSNNLPAVLSVFVGRVRELEEVGAVVGSSRLVTLTGAGGSGKTRLALQVAAELLDGSPDGVWLVELAPITEDEQVAAAVSAVLGLHDQGGRPLLEAVIEVLSEQNALLILDNCEHVIDATAKFADLVTRHCPNVRILATSREPLGIDGERIYRVPSLSLPPKDAETLEDLEGSDAVRLFVERAQMQDGGFSLDESDAALVASICRRLDGIPLALELAVARLSSMSLVHLSDRLDQRFRLLTGGSRSALARQQTLQATVDWSFGLLNGAEQAVLRRLSVFVGGFELEAAEAICTTHDADVFDVADLLGSLVDKSLVLADRMAGSLRYRLLETIRQFAANELLREGGEAEVVQARDRHADYYLCLAEVASAELTGRRQAAWLRRMDLEWDNLRAAFVELSAAPVRTDDVLRLGVALERFLLSRGHSDAVSYLRAAVEQAEPASTLLASGLVTTSLLVRFLLGQENVVEASAAKELAGRALTMARALGDARLEARALTLLSDASYFEHDPVTAGALGEQAVEIARRLGDIQLLGEALRTLAVLAPSNEECRRYRLEALECFRQTGDSLLASAELYSLSGLAVADGLIEQSRALIEEAIARAEDLGAELFLYFYRSDLGIHLVVGEDFVRAESMLRHCLLLARRIGLSQDLSSVLFGSACCATWRGDHHKAAQLHGAADVAIASGLTDGTIRWTAIEEQMRGQDQARLRHEMGAEDFELDHRLGQALSRQQAVDLALGRIPPV